MNRRNQRKAAILKALGHTTRLCIVEGLMRNACNVNHIVNCLHVPQATISQHLSVLKSQRLIQGERRGVEICYRVAEPRVAKIMKALR